MKTALYIRVSTTEQAQEGYSIPAQKDRLLSYCKSRDWTVMNIYVDDGYTGANLNRPGIQQLIAASKEIEVVLVYKLDRLSRSQKDTLYLIEEIFLRNGVNLVSIVESFDTSSSFGRAMTGILSVFAQLEREAILERSIMGRRERAKAGLYHGGAYTPIGYKYEEGRLTIDEYEAAQVREVFDLYLSGTGIRKISEVMNSKGYTYRLNSGREGNWGFSSSVIHCLDNIIYSGRIRFLDKIYPGKHDPIISPEVFEKVARLRQNKANKNYESHSLLTGFLFCGHCGARYFNRNTFKKKKYFYYICYSRAGNRNMTRDPACKNKIWKREDLDRVIEEEVFEVAENFNREKFFSFLQAGEEKRETGKAIKKEIEAIDKKIKKLISLYENDSIPEEVLSQRINELHRQRETLKQQSPPEEEKIEINFAGIEEVLRNIKEIWEAAPLKEKRNILRSLVERIILNGEEVIIEWTFL